MSNDYAHAAAMGQLIEAARPFSTKYVEALARRLQQGADERPELLRHPPQEPLRLRG